MSSSDENRSAFYDIRAYRESDENSWVRCRVLAFLDTSYRDDVQMYHESFGKESVSLVAVLPDTDEIIGILEADIDAGSDSENPENNNQVHASICSLAVLPEFRRQGIASSLWDEARKRLIAMDVQSVEAWTQDDAPANFWYRKKGFNQFHTYLNVYSRGPLSAGPMKDLLPEMDAQWAYGQIRAFNFEAPIEYREKLAGLSYRMHEVRGFRKQLIGEETAK